MTMNGLRVSIIKTKTEEIFTFMFSTNIVRYGIA